MKLEITIDIETAINNALRPEALQPILDKHITTAIDTAIRSATGYQSQFSKALEEQIKAALPHGLHISDVAKFQQVLNAAMNRTVQSCNEGAVRVALERAVQSVMPDVPPVLKLSELLKEARHGFHKGEQEEFYAHYEPSTHGDGGWLYLDENERPGSSLYARPPQYRADLKYSAKHRLAINGTGDVYTLRLDGTDITPASLPDVIGRFKSLLLAMYVGRTRLEIDIDADDVEAASRAQYD